MSDDLLKLTLGEAKCTESWVVKLAYYLMLPLAATLIFYLITNRVTQELLFGKVQNKNIKELCEVLTFFALILVADLIIMAWRNTICFVE